LTKGSLDNDGSWGVVTSAVLFLRVLSGLFMMQECKIDGDTKVQNMKDGNAQCTDQLWITLMIYQK
jgi:hypothetical protein